MKRIAAITTSNTPIAPTRTDRQNRRVTGVRTVG